MKIRHLQLLLFLSAIIGLISCGTSTPTYNYKELAKASIKLGIDIDMKDNHRLHVEASQWIGTPYKYAGNSKRGVDCSGFTTQIYRKVFDIKLQRSSEEQRSKDCRKISKRNLQEGDLVFFSSKSSKGKAVHAGIYLKNNKFIHASTNRGVTVSDLSENYYQRNWLNAGRTK